MKLEELHHKWQQSDSRVLDGEERTNDEVGKKYGRARFEEHSEKRATASIGP